MGFPIMIEPLKAWHDVTNLKFIIHVIKFQLHFNLYLLHALYLMSILAYISYIVHDCGTFKVTQKTQVMSFL